MLRVRPKVVIVGAGRGGLLAHLACARAGFDVEHFERQPHVGAAGAGIVVWPDGVKALVFAQWLRSYFTGARSARLIKGSAPEGQLTGAVVAPLSNGAIAAPKSPGFTESVPPSGIARDAKGGRG